MRTIFILSFITSLLLAAPAFQGKRIYTQPDGTEVTYHLQGDEHLHWMLSEDGDVLLFSKQNRRLEYAEIKDNTLRPSGIPVLKDDTNKTVHPTVSRDELSALHAQKRDEHLSKMKSRHIEH